MRGHGRRGRRRGHPGRVRDVARRGALRRRVPGPISGVRPGGMVRRDPLQRRGRVGVVGDAVGLRREPAGFRGRGVNGEVLGFDVDRGGQRGRRLQLAAPGAPGE